MNYKTIVNAVQMRYSRVSTEKGLPKLGNEEILFELSVNQAYLQSMYQVVDAKSYELQLVVDSDRHVVGERTTDIPTDIYKITSIELNDDVRSIVRPVGYSGMMDYHKSKGKPMYYCFVGQGAEQELIFDRRAESAYIATIKYVPIFELFLPDSCAGSLTWADYNPDEEGWGGAMKLPEEWLIVLMDLTLAKLLANPNLEQESMNKAEMLSIRKPVHSSGEIPYDNGMYSLTDGVLQNGEDRVRRRRW